MEGEYDPIRCVYVLQDGTTITECFAAYFETKKPRKMACHPNEPTCLWPAGRCGCVCETCGMTFDYSIGRWRHIAPAGALSIVEGDGGGLSIVETGQLSNLSVNGTSPITKQ